MPSLNIKKIRSDFPILDQKIYEHKSLVYFDNAASTQKPRQVIDTIDHYYTHIHANVHRGIHYLSQKASDAYKNAREKIKTFINVKEKEEIVFTRGTTEGINLVASSYGRKYIHEGDEIIISHMEHHSNIVPWKILCDEKGARLRVIPINDDGEIIYEEFKNLISEKTKFVSIVHVSNSLGTINPVKRIIEKAHESGIPVLVDGAQASAHLKIDVQDLDADFYVFSGHKTYGPTGIGVLYGKRKYLESMPPYQSGGDMINSVSFEKITFKDIPYKFEAGTPHICGAIGLGAAIDYIAEIGLNTITKYEKDLLDYATEKLAEVKNLKIIGTAKEKAAVISFVFDKIHPHDVGTVLDLEGIAIRTGHHCTEPLMDRFKVPATSRASFAFYNTKDEIDVFVKALLKVHKLFS